MAKNLIVVSDAYEKLSNITYPYDREFEAAAVVARPAKTLSPRVLSSISTSLTSFKDKADVATKVYDNCNLIKNAIDMFVDMVFHKLIIRHPDAEVQKTFEYIFRTSNIEETIEAILLDYFKYGNAFPLRYRGESEEDIFNPDMQDFEPYRWINIDPVQIEIQGATVKDIKYIVKATANSETFLPPVDSEEIDINLIYHIAAKKAGRDRKATPPLAGIARTVDLYNALMDLDISTVDQYVNNFLHVKVAAGPAGTPNSVPKASTVNKLTNSIRQMKTSGILVTTDNVTIEAIDLKSAVLDKAKYDTVLEQLEVALGITRQMVTSSVEGGGALQWFNITKMIKMLESARRKVQKWLEIEVKRMAIELQDEGVLSNLDQLPTLELDEVSIRDETKIRDILLKMYEKGLISPQEIHAQTGLDFNTEMNRKALIAEGEFEFDGKNIKYAELLAPPAAPFQGQFNKNGDNNKTGKEDKVDDSKVTDGGDGRPVGSDGEHENIRGEQ